MRLGRVLYEQVEQILRIFGYAATNIVLRLEREMASDSRGGKAKIESEGSTWNEWEYRRACRRDAYRRKINRKKHQTYDLINLYSLIRIISIYNRAKCYNEFFENSTGRKKKRKKKNSLIFIDRISIHNRYVRLVCDAGHSHLRLFAFCDSFHVGDAYAKRNEWTTERVYRKPRYTAARLR